MVYTSYFGRMNSKKYEHLKETGISIARGNKYWEGETYPALFPSWDIIQRAHAGTISKKEYEEIYKRTVLDKLNPSQVYADLNNRILLCWEKTDDIENGINFCHRYIVADWLRENGFQAEELK